MTAVEVPGFSRYYVDKQLDSPEYGRPRVVGWTVWDRRFINPAGVPRVGAVAALARTRREALAWVQEFGVPDGQEDPDQAMAQEEPPRKCLDHVLVYLDGKAEYEWACELERGHDGPHTEGRYGWLA